MNVTLRTLSGGTVAFSSWLLPDQSTVVSKLTQEQYDVWDKQGDAPGKPTKDAQFLVAMGGILALAGGDGWPQPGDVWERTLGGRKRLMVALSDEPGWGYIRHDVGDPLNGFSHVTGFHVRSNNRCIPITTYNINNLPTLDITPGGVWSINNNQITIPAELIKTEYIALDFQTPNHRSVSYGSSTSSYDNFTYPNGFTYAGPSISGSDTHLVISAALEYSSNPSAVTHNGDTCTQRILAGTSGALRVIMYDRSAPNTSGNVAVTIADGTAYVSTASYATGVDGGNPRVDFDSATGTSTSPSVTSDSTTDGLAFTALAISDAPTLTKDASVTTIVTIDNGNGTIGGGGGDVALFSGYETPGGITNTVTHTLSSSVAWRIGQITLRAAATGRTTRNTRSAPLGMEVGMNWRSGNI